MKVGQGFIQSRQVSFDISTLAKDFLILTIS